VSGVQADTTSSERWVYTHSYLDGLPRAEHKNFFVQFFYNIGVGIVVCVILGGIMFVMWLGR
jgi:hypothetical protein